VKRRRHHQEKTSIKKSSRTWRAYKGPGGHQAAGAPASEGRIKERRTAPLIDDTLIEKKGQERRRGRWPAGRARGEVQEHKTAFARGRAFRRLP